MFHASAYRVLEGEKIKQPPDALIIRCNEMIQDTNPQRGRGVNYLSNARRAFEALPPTSSSTFICLLIAPRMYKPTQTSHPLLFYRPRSTKCKLLYGWPRSWAWTLRDEPEELVVAHMVRLRLRGLNYSFSEVVLITVTVFLTTSHKYWILLLCGISLIHLFLTVSIGSGEASSLCGGEIGVLK